MPTGPVYANVRPSDPPQWMSWIGAVAVVLGILLTAQHANEWMKQTVIARATPDGGGVPVAECPADELEEEGISQAECEQLVANVRNVIVSSPAWFPAFGATLAALGTFIAMTSVLVGAALVDNRGWAPAAALVTFSVLLGIDVAGFVAVLNTGPILRGIYLSNILLWFFIHLMLTVGVTAGLGQHRERRASAALPEADPSPVAETRS